MSVRPCPNCGEPLHTRWFDNVAWCPYCHRPNRPVPRPADTIHACVCCGAEIHDDRLTCPNCDAGERIE